MLSWAEWARWARVWWIVGFAGACALGTAEPALAQCGEGLEVFPPDLAANDRLGRSVDTDGARALVGAPDADDAGTDAGAAYLYRQEQTGWTLEGQLVAADAVPGDRFGNAVAIDTPWAAVAAPAADASAGAVYVFFFDGARWSEAARLSASDAFAGERFGTSLALEGETLLVGVPQRDDDAGGVYVFTFDGMDWGEDAILAPAGLEPGDKVGASVSLRGNRLIFGAPGDDDQGLNAGAAYIYREVGGLWGPEAKLQPTDVVQNDDFGRSVGIALPYAVGGSPLDDDVVDASGSATIFFFDGAGWSQVQKIAPADVSPFDFFGSAVAIDGDTILASSPDDDDNGTSSGSAYVWERGPTTWVETRKLIAPDGDNLDKLGESIALGGAFAWCGADGHDGVGPDSGTSYVYRLFVTEDCNGNGIEDACDIEDGTEADCNCNGVPDGCDIASGESADVNGDGIPDECDIDCNANGLADVCEVQLGLAADCDDDGVLDECQIAAGTSTDCDGNGVPDACDVGVALVEDCDGDGTPDPCQLVTTPCLDCNGNGRLDGCDIDDGISLDLDGDGVPDDCELPFRRGETNGDGLVDLGDALFIAESLFIDPAPTSPCVAAQDVNDDGVRDISDALYLILYLFLGHAEPPPPFLACGQDDDAACLPCTSFDLCP